MTLAPSTGRGIAATDREIDELLYQPYGVTDEERGVVEGQNWIPRERKA
jgi:hypothetical protein